MSNQDNFHQDIVPTESEASRPTNSSGQTSSSRGRVADLTLAQIQNIRILAEQINPGVSSRVCAADWESILVAYHTTCGANLVRRVAYTPPASVTRDLSETVSSLSRALANLSQSQVSETKRNTSGKAARGGKTTPAPSTKARAGVSGKVGKGKSPPAKPSGSQPRAETARGSAVTQQKSPKEELLKKALRSLKSWSSIAKVLAIDETKVREAVAQLPDAEVEHNKDMPPLARLGLITPEAVEALANNTQDWASSVETEEKIAEVRDYISRARRVFFAHSNKGIDRSQWSAPVPKESFKSGDELPGRFDGALVLGSSIEELRDIPEGRHANGTVSQLLDSPVVRDALANQSGVPPNEWADKMFVICSEEFKFREQDGSRESYWVKTVVGFRGTPFRWVFYTQFFGVTPSLGQLKYLALTSLDPPGEGKSPPRGITNVSLRWKPEGAQSQTSVVTLEVMARVRPAMGTTGPSGASSSGPNPEGRSKLVPSQIAASTKEEARPKKPPAKRGGRRGRGRGR